MINTTAFDIDIIVEDQEWQKCLPGYEDLCQKTTNVVFSYINLIQNIEKHVEFSITLTNDKQIQSLNADYRGKNKPTNVLSFPQIIWSQDDWKDEPVLMLGDVVISIETLKKECEEQSKTFEDHFTHMLVHSLVHLFGYDHETDEEAEEMESLEIKILKDMDIKNPYQTI